MPAKVIGRIDLSKVIKVKNEVDKNASTSVMSAVRSLTQNGATIDMVAKRIRLNPKRPLGLKLLSRVDELKKAGYAVLNA